VAGAKDAPIIRKILSLDGGGVRGLSAIIILKHIMKILNKKRGFVVDPWQEFDMIGGTSTGGLLAIMLGRLRMSLDECEKKYLQLSEKIFTPARSRGNVVGKGYDLLQANGKFKSEPLESTIQEILVSLRLSVDELLLDNDPESCKV
jgi:patatin-like phospholipase/acyl hydrolase